MPCTATLQKLLLFREASLFLTWRPQNLSPGEALGLVSAPYLPLALPTLTSVTVMWQVYPSWVSEGLQCRRTNTIGRGWHCPFNIWDIDTLGLMGLGQGGDIGYDSLIGQHTLWYKYTVVWVSLLRGSLSLIYVSIYRSSICPNNLPNASLDSYVN